MRNFALTHDNLVSVDLVTAAGSSLTAGADDHTDLFWALRGGGGNFGIVTSFTYRLHRLGPVLGGMAVYPQAEAPAVVGGWRDVLVDAPDELMSAAVFLTTPDGIPAVAVAPCWSGDDLGAGERAVAPLRRLGTVAADMVGPMPYVQMQSMLDPGFEPGWRYYQRAGFLDALSDDFIRVAGQRYAVAPSPLCAIACFVFGGAMSRVAPDASAFPHRNSPFYVDLISAWTDPADDERCVAWLKETWDAFVPFFGRDAAVDVNHIDRGEDRVRAAYGPANYERLVTLKRTYDPENLFRLNQNIKPAG
jgi:FAD/FMN-containing dehydrogenase